MTKPLYSILIILATTSLVSCSKYDIEKDTPSCIKSKIKQFDKEIECDNGVKVSKYTFQGTNVYVFNPGTCGADMTSEVVNSSCESQGHLGGFAGNVIINGETFNNAVFVGDVWIKN